MKKLTLSASVETARHSTVVKIKVGSLLVAGATFRGYHPFTPAGALAYFKRNLGSFTPGEGWEMARAAGYLAA